MDNMSSGGRGRPPSGPYDDMLWIRIGEKFKGELKRKASEYGISELVRKFLEIWAKEHGCEVMNTELNIINIIRVVDRYMNEEFNLPRLTYALPKFIYDGKLTHPIIDMLPKGLSILLFGE
jgi:hypothetical protein